MGTDAQSSGEASAQIEAVGVPSRVCIGLALVDDHRGVAKVPHAQSASHGRRCHVLRTRRPGATVFGPGHDPNGNWPGLAVFYREESEAFGF